MKSIRPFPRIESSRPGVPRPQHLRQERSAAGADPGTEIDVETSVKDAFAKGWGVVVWNDPVNLMSYVVFVLQRVLKMNKGLATKHMLEVHQSGKSLVAKETKEKAELLVHQLQGFGLQATMESLA